MQKFADENPKNVDALVLLAQWRVQRGETAAALALADDLAKQYPDAPGAKLLRADIRLAAGKLDEALPILEDLRTSGALPEAVAVLRARAALMGHRLDEAAAALAQTGEGFQRSGLGKLWQGELSGARGDFERAATDFSDSLHVSSLQPAARQGLIQALAALSLQKDPAAVEAKVNQLLAAFPREPLLLAIGAELAARQGRFDQAMTMLDRADGLQANSLLIVRAKAATRLQMGQVEQALAEAKRALQIDPRDVPSQLLAAQADLARNKPEAALASVEQALASPAQAARGPPAARGNFPPPGARRRGRRRPPRPHRPTARRYRGLHPGRGDPRRAASWGEGPGNPPRRREAISRRNRCSRQAKLPCSAAWDGWTKPRSLPANSPARNRMPRSA